jgi:hypothetical protein
MKDWLKKYKNKGIAVAAVLAVLIFAFWYGGSGPGMRGWTVTATVPASETETVRQEETKPSRPAGAGETAEATKEAKPADPSESSGETETTEAAPIPVSESSDPAAYAETPAEGPAEETILPETAEAWTAPPETPAQTEAAKTCTISISCASVLNHWDLLDPGKADIIPGDGWILSEVTVGFEEGETAFDVLQRVCRERGIPMEGSWTPLYGSSYVEGIANLYEFDCGSMSGWLYSVNGWFPNDGGSGYALQDKDAVRWVYTCDFGKDVGGGN